MRAFLKTPGNGLFAGGLSFAVGLDFDAKKRDWKKLVHLEAIFFGQKYDFLLPDFKMHFKISIFSYNFVFEGLIFERKTYNM